MSVSDFLQCHAGKSVVFIAAGAFLLAWPPALPWIAAAGLLHLGVRHLVLAFREVEREAFADSRIATGTPSFSAPDSERRLVVARNSAVPARSQVDRA
jgi:hypothetical protein